MKEIAIPKRSPALGGTGFCTLLWPLLGARPYSVSAALRLISSRSNSNISTSSYPPFAAYQSGVRPYSVSVALGLTSFCRNNMSTTQPWPPTAVQPLVSATLISHCFIANKATSTSAIPRNAAPWSLVKPLRELPL